MRATRVGLAPSKYTDLVTSTAPLSLRGCPLLSLDGRRSGHGDVLWSRRSENVSTVALRNFSKSQCLHFSPRTSRIISTSSRPLAPLIRSSRVRGSHSPLQPQRRYGSFADDGANPWAAFQTKHEYAKGGPRDDATSVYDNDFDQQLQELQERPLHNLKDLSSRQPNLIFVSASTDPVWNLSAENYLLRNSHHDSHILFLYINRPSIVYGRNQNPWVECNLPAVMQGLPGIPPEDDQTRQINLIRRHSGGGTVFHDEGNLNYCAIVPNDRNFSRHKHAEMVVKALHRVQNERLDFAPGHEIKVNERHDIVMRSRDASTTEPWLKISGSAYKLIRGRALHHGTLLFDSPYLKKISGLLNGPGKNLIKALSVGSVRSPVANLLQCPGARLDGQPAQEEQQQKLIRTEVGNLLQQSIIDEWLEQYANLPLLPTPIAVGSLSSDSTHQIDEGCKEMRSPEWLYGSTPRCTFEHTLDGAGTPKLRLEINRGVVEKVTIVDGDDTTYTSDFVGQAGPSERHGLASLKVWEIEDWRAWLWGLFQHLYAEKVIDAHTKAQLEYRLPETNDGPSQAAILKPLAECFPARPDLRSEHYTSEDGNGGS